MISRRRVGLNCFIVILTLAAACAEPPTILPPGIVGLELGMSVKDIKKIRATMDIQSSVRAFDPVERIALALKDDKVTGIRIFIPTPTSELVQQYYATHFKDARSSKYQYEIEGKNLSLYAVSGGIDLLYGVDPGGTSPSDGPQKQQKAQKKQRGLIHLREGPTLNTPKYFPVARSLDGITVWLHPIGEPTNGPASLKIFINTGSADEIEAEKGVTGVVTELLALKISTLTRKMSVRMHHLVLRSGILFSFEGSSEDVQAVGVAFGKNVKSFSAKSLNSERIARAFQSSLQNTIETNLDHKIIMDEGFGAAFPDTRLAHAPVHKKHPIPTETVLRERIKVINKAAINIVAAGSIGPKFAVPIVEALGVRAANVISPLPPTDKRKRVNRKLKSPMIAVDGFIVGTSSISALAQLFVAREYLDLTLQEATLFSNGVNIQSQNVLLSGQMGARLLMTFATARGARSKEASAAIESFWMSLPNKEVDKEQFNNIRQGAISAFSLAWSAPATATDMMLKLAMMKLSVEDIRTLWTELSKVQSKQIKDLLAKYAKADQRFSVRWSPEL